MTRPMTEEGRDLLEPCLRCSAAVTLHENDWATPPLWSFCCSSCGLRGKEWPQRAEAIADANRRSTSSAERGMREALEKAQKTLQRASRELSENHRLILQGKRWGGETLDAIDAALDKAAKA